MLKLHISLNIRSIVENIKKNIYIYLENKLG